MSWLMGKLGVDSIGVKGDEETECLWRGLQHFCGGEKETLNENKVEEKRERKKKQKKKKRQWSLRSDYSGWMNGIEEECSSKSGLKDTSEDPPDDFIFFLILIILNELN